MENTKKVGVLFSGGVESTLILYEAMLKYDNVYALSESGGDRYHITSTIINKLENLTGKKIQKHILMIFDFEIIDNKQVTKEPLQNVYRRYLIKNNIDIVYAGTNKFYEELPELGGPRKDLRSNIVKMPYWDMYKHEVMEKYYKYGIQHLIKYCVSCTHHRKDFTCGKCYDCKERKIAETRLDKKTL